jgi:small nuclear ribonucleoprotein (snRNP)-like protein
MTKTPTTMRKIIPLILLIFTFTSVLAQNQKVQVYLKNGSIVKGKLTESTSSETIKVESNNTIWVFQNAEVDTIIVGKPEKYLNIIEIPYFIDAEYGILVGNSSNEENNIGFFHGSFNYQLANKYYTGVGAGVEYYMEQSYIPVFAKFEYRFRPTKFSPYVFLKSGYLIPGENLQSSEIYEQYESRNIPTKYLNASGGLMLNPGFGFTTFLGENFGLCFSMGYRFHVLNFTGKDEYELEQRYTRLSFSMGIIFK